MVLIACNCKFIIIIIVVVVVVVGSCGGGGGGSTFRNLLSTDFASVRFVVYDLKVSHRRHVCNR
jgi:hypothetical protein